MNEIGRQASPPAEQPTQKPQAVVPPAVRPAALSPPKNALEALEQRMTIYQVQTTSGWFN